MIREVLLKRNETIAMTDDDLAVQYALSRTFDESVDDEDEDNTTAAATKNKEQGRKALEMINSLRLSNELVWERERAMPKVESPWVIEIPYIALCALLDVWFPETKPIQRFWFLETVARMPYFSYTSMLTLYEILGWWRRSSDLRKVHFAEEWNEYHHLLIMESLGGDRAWSDRFLAQHAALAYYLGLIVMWLLSPALAYNFSEKIETHAVATYAQFVEENAELLASLPAPEIAKKYYEADDLYLFDEFQTTTISKGEILLNKLDDIKGKKEEDVLKTRRPVITTLKDVFDNICEDEKEHVGTMNACQMPDMTLATANRINALIAVGGVALVASKYAERFATTLAEDSAATDGLEDLIGSGRLLDLITFLTSLFSDLPFL
jgi:ubiquinol oxidase